MKFEKKQLLLYAVTDCPKDENILYEKVEQALIGGATIIQLRLKNVSQAEVVSAAKKLLPLCHGYCVPLIVNDDPEAARLSGADGVHVGAEDMSVAEIRAEYGENFIIGATAKTIEQAQQAEADGADYLGSGAVFPSPTKTDAVRITNEQLTAIRGSVDIPVVAIGGISEANAESLCGTEIDGIAVVSALFSADDTKSAAERLRVIAEKVTEKRMRKVLTIAGSDSSGGAGIQADIKTMTAHGVFAESAVTALTAQNTLGVTGIMEATPEILAKQLDAVFTDIFPDAVKVGMVSSPELIGVIAEKLKQYKAKNIVVDTVMVSTSGTRLLKEEAVSVLIEKLMPLADIVTPNIPEAEILSGMKITSAEDTEKAARIISGKCGCAVLCKGGHGLNDADDYLLTADGRGRWFRGRRIDNKNTHGTGCTLSSAIASRLAQGKELDRAVKLAKEYISGALEANLDLGHCSGPLNHMFNLKD